MSVKTRKPGWTYFSSAAAWFDQSLSLDAIIVWHVLMVFRNHHTGKCHPTIWTIGQVSRIGRRRVDAAMKELVKAGIIQKLTKTIQAEGRLSGKKCFYTVAAMDKWVTREKLYLGTEHTISERSVTERSVVNQKQLPTPNQLPTPDHQGKNTLRPSSEFRFPDGDPEKSSLLADWGIDTSVASMLFDRMEALAWRTPEGSPFSNETHARNFVSKLAVKMEAQRRGEHTESLKGPPVRSQEKVSVAPVATHSQEAEWQESDNDGEYM